MGDSASPTNLSQFRRRHSALMREALKEEGVAGMTDRVEAFMSELADFGAGLSAEDDRASAQNILDYWAASLAGTGETRRPRQAVRLRPFAEKASPVASRTALPEGNPFRNIAAISRSDGTRLPGREDSIRAVLALIESHGLVFITGAAGSGRSALVNAGVLWQIENSDEPASVFRVPTPAPEPLAALAACVPGATAAEIAASPQKFRARFDVACGDHRGILAIDNAEEMFTRCTGQKGREAFAAAVAALCVPGPDGRRNDAILILRDEWAEQVLALKSFAPLAKGARFTPPPPTAAELQRTIEIPAAAAGVTFEPGIVEDLARELQGDVGALPLVQFMLMQLWPLSSGGRITSEVYRKLGRPYDALTNVAEATYVSLPPEDQKAAEEMFLALTRPSLDGSDTGTARSRRESRLALEERGGGRAVAAFQEAGLLRASGSGGGDDSIEIVHDGLMYRWDRLVGWLVDERRRSGRRTTLVASARLWQASGRRSGYLIADRASLEEARQYVSTAPELGDLVAASETYLRRQSTIRQVGIGVLVSLVVLFGAAATSALYLWTAAADDADAARKAEQQATLARRRAEQAATASQKVIDELTQNLRITEARLATTTPSPTPASADRNQAALAAANIAPDSVLDIYGVRPGASGRIAGYLWIGSDDKPNIGGAVLPSAVKRGGRFTLTKNIVLRQARPTDDYTQAPSLGVLPSGSVVTATADPIAYNRSLGVQFWLPVEADPPPPTIALQYASAPLGKLEAIAGALKGFGYQVPGIDQTDLGKGLNEVRWFNQQDKAAADKLAEQTSRILNAQGLPTIVKSVDFSSSRYKVQPGNVELWLDLARR